MPEYDVILLVDDSADDVWAFRRAFQQIGWPAPLQVVESGDAAIEYLEGVGKYHNRNEYPLPTLVLLDLKMPGTDGFDVLKWIRSQESLNTMRVVVLTTSEALRDINRAYALGANSFLTKPLDLAEFQHMLAALTRHWLKDSRAPESRREPSETPKQKS